MLTRVLVIVKFTDLGKLWTINKFKAIRNKIIFNQFYYIQTICKLSSTFTTIYSVSLSLSLFHTHTDRYTCQKWLWAWTRTIQRRPSCRAWVRVQRCCPSRRRRFWSVMTSATPAPFSTSSQAYDAGLWWLLMTMMMLMTMLMVEAGAVHEDWWNRRSTGRQRCDHLARLQSLQLQCRTNTSGRATTASQS